MMERIGNARRAVLAALIVLGAISAAASRAQGQSTARFIPSKATASQQQRAAAMSHGAGLAANVPAHPAGVPGGPTPLYDAGQGSGNAYYLGFATVNGTYSQQQVSFTTYSASASFVATVGLRWGSSYKVGPVSCTQTYGNAYDSSAPYVNSCSVTVTLVPLYPGGHRDSIFVYDTNGTSLASAFLYGIGVGPQLMIQPGLDSYSTLPGNGYLYGGAVDDRGDYFVYTNSTLYAVTGSTPTALTTSFPGGYNGPTSIDGAGNLFTPGNGGSIYSGNEFETLTNLNEYASLSHYIPCQCDRNPQILAYTTYFNQPTTVAAGNFGTFYEADSGGEYVDGSETGKYPPVLNAAAYSAANGGGYAYGGTTPGYPDNGPITTVTGTLLFGFFLFPWPNAGYTPSTMLVDPYENLFFADSNGIREWAGWGQVGDGTLPSNQTVTLLNNVSPVGNMAVDAADTLYVGAGAGVQMYPASNSYASPITTIGISNGSGNYGGGSGNTVGPDGTLFVNSGSYLHVIDRSHGKVDFTGSDGTANPYTATIYNGGNEPLTIATIALDAAGVSSGFTLPGTGSTPCTSGIKLGVGAVCHLTIVSTAPHVGALSGTVTVVSNSLNSSGTTQTITLTDNISGIYAVASPNPLSFPPVTAPATSTLPVTVVNTSVPSMSLGNPSTIIINGTSFTTENPGFVGSAGACAGVSEPSGGPYCTINVTFNPALATSMTGHISWQESLTSAGYGAIPTQTVNLTVNATSLLTIQANNVTRSFLATTSGFNYTPTGFVNGDTASVLSGTPTYTTPATLNSPAGNYPISIAQGTLTAPSYYSLSFQPGTLTVTGNIAQVIQFPPLPAYISLAVGKLTLVAHSTSGLPITYTVSGPASLSGYTLSLTGTGTVTVTANQAGNTTFNPAASVVRTFTVTP